MPTVCKVHLMVEPLGSDSSHEWLFDLRPIEESATNCALPDRITRGEWC